MDLTESNFILNGQRYTLEDLRQGNFSSAVTEFERATLEFCQAWLRGDADFAMTTSGSTGTPKAITVSRKAMEASARATAVAVNLKAGDTALVCLNTRYIAGRMMLVRCFVVGMRAYVVEPTANPFEALPPEVQIDFMALVPYQLSSILASENGRQKVNQVRSILLGGAEADAKTRSVIYTLKPGVFATYGMTETISHVALQKLNAPGQQDHFYALPEVAFSVDDRGCLVIQAPYLGIDGLATNDLVDLLSPSEFRWLGRRDNVINSGGVKVIPEKAEKAVAEFFRDHSLHCRFFIAGLPDEVLGQVVTLIVEGTLSDGKESSLSKYLSETLTRYEVPKRILYLDKFLETETGKINRLGTLRDLN